MNHDLGDIRCVKDMTASPPRKKLTATAKSHLNSELIASATKPAT